MKVVALAGGVGGAKLADGLALVLPAEDLTIIVNTGDDFEHLGLYICPDLDTVCYTLGGIANLETGWGRTEESWNALENLHELGGPDWFRVGDKDLGTHLERTRRIKEGEKLSDITADFCRSWGVGPRVLPMSDDQVRTMVATEEEELAFQEYFVAQKCEPRVNGFRFDGVEKARPAAGVLESFSDADLIVFCPSNPWVSIDPILAVPGVREGLAGKCVIAVSPIIDGRALKGPAAKMYAELGIEPSAAAVAKHYGTLLSGFVMDNEDAGWAAEVEATDISVLLTGSVMQSRDDRRQLAEETLKFGDMILKRGA